ncbi:MAG: hypothetical protein C5B50_14885 [Verrucomicrobia bacterium]|nr:MAG: hypothetical protein C5B50_14885 [Verrucomicrobiota bacterium]
MKKTILLAEDDKRLATALTVRLDAAGYNVLAVPDAFRSYMAAVGQKPDLILMDITMPYGEGFAVARELRDVNLSDIPIIFMTASSRKSLYQQAQELGAAGFFRKPFDSKALLATIAQLLNKSKRNNPALDDQVD